MRWGFFLFLSSVLFNQSGHTKNQVRFHGLAVSDIFKVILAPFPQPLGTWCWILWGRTGLIKGDQQHHILNICPRGSVKMCLNADTQPALLGVHKGYVSFLCINVSPSITYPEPIKY